MGLLEHLRNGDRLALARAISAVENDLPESVDIARAIYQGTGRAHPVGVTGAPGVGKSTLVSALVRELRSHERTVAVLAVDPSSPLTGGAILGDRVRMGEHSGDFGVFIRSVSARGHVGGLARMTARILDLLDAAQFDTIIIETVGGGQSDVEIARFAATVVVVVAPNLGDQIQALKAGVFEIASVLVVNKADLPNADRAESYLRSAFALGDRPLLQVPIVQTSAAEGRGIAELLGIIDAQRAHLHRNTFQVSLARSRHLLATEASRLVRERIEVGVPSVFDPLCDAFLRGDLSLSAASARALCIVANEGQDLDQTTGSGLASLV